MVEWMSKREAGPLRIGRRSSQGFTMAELLMAAVIMILAFAGILVSYLRCLDLSELCKNSSIAVQASKSRLESIKNTAFSQIKPTYNNATFTAAGLNGIGVSYVDDTNPNLLKVTVTFCWRQSNRRIIGEDTDLNGAVNGTEDKNGNGMLDSIVQLVSYVFNE